MSHEERRQQFHQRKFEAANRKRQAELRAEMAEIERRQTRDTSRRLRRQAAQDALHDIADAQEEVAMYTRMQFDMDLMRNTQQWMKDNL